MSKRLTLNNEKRKNIENVFKSYWEKNNIFIQQLNEAKNKYNSMRTKMLELCNNIVREHQPQEDVDTIRSMINKYGEENGGRLYHDNCFNFYRDSVNDDGEEDTEEVNVDFSLDDNKKFARAYYRDELIANGVDADYQYRWDTSESWKRKTPPKYYEEENKSDSWLGFSNSSNEDKSIIKPTAEWARDKIWVIGSNYCSSRKFKVDDTVFLLFQEFNKQKEHCALMHEKLFSYAEEKLKKLRLGLKSYKYFDQAKELADKLNIPLNEGILNESSSMALSVYSPENLASLLEDTKQQTREEKIAIARAALAQQATVN